MKILVIIAVVALVVSGGLIFYGLSESEPDYFLYAAVVAGFGLAPALINGLINGFSLAGASTKSAINSAIQKQKIRAEESRIIAQAKAEEKEVSLDSSNETIFLPSDSETKNLQTEYVKLPGIDLKFPAHKKARIVYSLGALLAFFLLPQWQLLSYFNGFEILKAMGSNFDGMTYYEDSLPVIIAGLLSFGTTSIIGVIAASADKPSIERNTSRVAVITLAIVYMYFTIGMIKDGVFPINFAVGFAFGYYIVFALAMLHFEAAQKALKNR